MTRCECHRLDIDSTPCDRPRGRKYRLIRVVPMHDHGSARASGAFTRYGGIDAVPVSESCYRGWVEDYLDGGDPDMVEVSDLRGWGSVR